MEATEATEIAEKIHGEEHELHSAKADANFRKFTGIYLGIIAMLLAITALGGSNATKTMLNSNIQASDIYGYYQAKNIRQTVYQLTAEQLELGTPCIARYPPGHQGQDRRQNQTLSREGRPLRKRPVNRRRQERTARQGKGIRGQA